jgi:hypothetical protein
MAFSEFAEWTRSVIEQNMRHNSSVTKCTISYLVARYSTSLGEISVPYWFEEGNEF